KLMCSHTSKNIHPTVLRGLAEIDISNGDYKAAALKLDAALLRLDLATDRTPEETLLLPQLNRGRCLGRLSDCGIPAFRHTRCRNIYFPRSTRGPIYWRLRSSKAAIRRIELLPAFFESVIEAGT